MGERAGGNRVRNDVLLGFIVSVDNDDDKNIEAFVDLLQNIENDHGNGNGGMEQEGKNGGTTDEDDIM